MTLRLEFVSDAEHRTWCYRDLGNSVRIPGTSYLLGPRMEYGVPRIQEKRRFRGGWVRFTRPWSSSVRSLQVFAGFFGGFRGRKSLKSRPQAEVLENRPTDGARP